MTETTKTAPIHIEYRTQVTVTDVNALRSYAIKIATERGELDYYTDSERNAIEGCKADGEEHSAVMHDLLYLIEANPFHDKVQNPETKMGAKWRGSTAIELEE